MKSLLVLDCNYLCWKSFYSTGMLSHGSEPTGTVFGFLRDVKTLTERFGTDQVVFAFDQKPYARSKDYFAYKMGRQINPGRGSIRRPDEPSATDEMREQVEKLKTEYLPGLGYKNVFWQKGMEADDVIAAVVENKDPKQDCVVVSADHDLYQLLRPGVVIHQPREKRVVDRNLFMELHSGLVPEMWPKVKALAGCPSDNIPGLRGVATLTAVRYFRGMCTGPGYARGIASKIAEYLTTDEYALNLKLVTLPHPMCFQYAAEPQPEIRESAWKTLTEKLGITSLNTPSFSGTVNRRGTLP